MRLVLLVLLLPTSALAQIAFPILESESTSYSRQQYDQSQVIQLLIQPQGEGNERTYRFAFEGEDLRWESIFDAGGFPIVYEKKEWREGVEVTRKEELAYQPTYLKEEQILALGTESLIFALRSYPFTSPTNLNVRFPANAQREDFYFQVQYRGRESLEVNGRRYQTHKLELVPIMGGAMGMFAGFFPKTFFWYEERFPHRLIKQIAAENDKEEVVLEILP
jgi:hypothetical protein